MGERRTGACRLLMVLVATAALPLCASCAAPSGSRIDMAPTAYVARNQDAVLAGQESSEDERALFSRYAPIVVVQDSRESHNRVGTPVAQVDSCGRMHVQVDPSVPTLYAQKQEFATERGAYVNLIYRVHFQGVPGLRLTRGANVGLFIIVTLNARGEPVLVTTVHTCGCYLALVPTTYLPAECRPEGWDPSEQKIHGETMPGLLRYPGAFADNYRPVVFVRDDTHRVMDVRVQDVGEAAWRYEIVPAELQPMESLKTLRANGGTTSFFHSSGRRKGYVKGSSKPLEMLLMSWMALDLYVGRDKALGDRKETGVTFYTSLKPWRRTESDMWPFADFLKYWGWRL